MNGGYGFALFIGLILFGLARVWRRAANENRNSIPSSAPKADESIDGYYRRMDGADVPESAAMARLRALNTYRPSEPRPMVTVRPALRRADTWSEQLDALSEKEGHGGY